MPFVLQALAIGGIAAAMRLVLLLVDAFPFNADEAIVGLMGRHILQGRWSVFFYGQAYMGSLDASLVALGFGIFGEKIWVIRAIQSLLYFGTVVSTCYLGRRIFGSEKMGAMAGLLMAVPTVNVLLYTTALCGYGEAMLIGNLLLLLGLSVKDNPERMWRYAAWGLLAGLGFWGFGLVVVFAISASVLIFQAAFSRKGWVERLARFGTVVAAFLVGVGPILYWIATSGFGGLLSEMAGSAIAGANSLSGLSALGFRLVNLLLFGTTVTWGLRPPWGVRWLAVPLAPIATSFWLATTVYAVLSLRRRDSARAGRWLMFGIAACLIGGYLATPFGADPSGRYFVPLAVPLAISAVDMLERLLGGKRWAWAVLSGVLTFNFVGTVQSALRNPPGLTTQFDAVTRIDHSYDQELIEFLEQSGELRGYTNYWVAYPLAFQSQEQLIFVPKLPYHHDFRYTSRDDRIPDYTAAVQESEKVAYITTNHPALDSVLEDAFIQANITWEETRIGDYHVFYRLSKPVRPEDIADGW
ncbi:MAG: glycosyltransferase family 39 protein [Anaerolineales bacterium]|jgi:4-amino-4-deoxy-L-arabinose transferase-like glycosyltransferase